LISRYLAKRLTDAEELMVETRIVEDPGFRSEVELTAALREGMRELESRGEVTRILAVESAAWRRPRVALAASLGAIALGLVSLIFYQQRDTLAPAAATETLRFELTRGNAAETDVAWERGRTPVQLEMRFDVGPEPAAAYHVTISGTQGGAGGAAVDRVVQTSPDGEIVLAVDGRVLHPGIHEIRLEPQPATESVEAVTYTLAVNSR
jgi:hypothetical protein